jgi:hypothetical protein
LDFRGVRLVPGAAFIDRAFGFGLSRRKRRCDGGRRNGSGRQCEEHIAAADRCLEMFAHCTCRD